MANLDRFQLWKTDFDRKKSNFSSFWSLELTHYFLALLTVRLEARTQELEKFDFFLSKLKNVSKFPILKGLPVGGAFGAD